MPLQWVSPNNVKDQTNSPMWKGISWSSNENTIDMVPTNVGMLFGLGPDENSYCQLFIGYNNSGIWYRNCSVGKKTIEWVKVAGSTSNETLFNKKVDKTVYRNRGLLVGYTSAQTQNTWVARFRVSSGNMMDEKLMYTAYFLFNMGSYDNITEDIELEIKLCDSAAYPNWDGTVEAGAKTESFYHIFRISGSAIKFYGVAVPMCPSINVKSWILKLRGLSSTSNYVKIKHIYASIMSSSLDSCAALFR